MIEKFGPSPTFTKIKSKGRGFYMPKTIRTDRECWDDYMKLMKERPEEFKIIPGGLQIITNVKELNEFYQETGKQLGVLYKSPYHMLVVDLVKYEGGKPFAYERLLSTATQGACVALVSTHGDKYVLLKQYRHAMRDYQYAVPRGRGEIGLTADQNVTKELSEEIGASADKTVSIGTVVADSGVSGVSVTVYHCEVSDYKLDRQHEGIDEIVEVTEEELQELIRQGKINDGFTLAALSLYRAFAK